MEFKQKCPRIYEKVDQNVGTGNRKLEDKKEFASLRDPTAIATCAGTDMEIRLALRTAPHHFRGPFILTSLRP